MLAVSAFRLSFKRPDAWTYVALDAGLMDDLIDLVGRHTGLRGGRSDIKNFSREFTGLAHCLLTLVVEDVDLIAVRDGAAVFGVAVLPPGRVRNGLGQGAVLGQRVYGS